jgi:uncharacterized membrane protein YgdD (TMEM256/DUF423 family)
MNFGLMPRLTLFFAGLIGAFGVGFSALAAHGGDTRLYGAAALICLTQAPALLALSIGWRTVRTALAASALIGIGSILFAGDVSFLARFGHGLFPMAAPTGGTMMILGWLAVAAGAFFRLGER